MAFETHVAGLSIHELLRVISNAALSGVLTVITPSSTGRIVFTWGRVTHAATEGQERIGELLVRHGFITEEQVATALEAQAAHRRPRPLGTFITSLGYADSATVGKLLREQMKNAFFEMMGWSEGTAQLEVDIEVVLASVRLDVSLDTPTLLLEAARQRDEADGASERVAESADLPSEPIAFLHPFDNSPFEEWQILKLPSDPAPAAAAAPELALTPEELPEGPSESEGAGGEGAGEPKPSVPV